MDLPVAILAGGLATRLRPLTEKIPKLLVEVAGEPFFSHQLRLLRAAGLKKIVLCVGHLGEQIVRQYGDGSAWGVKIEYSFDNDDTRGSGVPAALSEADATSPRPRLLGTGGALIRALPKLGEAFYVLYGDSYLPIDYRAVGEAFRASGKPALMTVYENQGRYDTSNVRFEDGLIRVYDKKRRLPEMHHIDYGLGVFAASAFDGLPRDRPVDLADVQRDLAQRGRLAGFEIAQRFYEIGSPAGLAELNLLLTSRPA